MTTLLGIIYAITSVLLVIIVLIQSGKGAGMGIFGGGSSTTFGAQSGDILTKITTVLGVVFFGIALLFAVAKPWKSNIKAGGTSATGAALQPPGYTNTGATNGKTAAPTATVPGPGSVTNR